MSSSQDHGRKQGLSSHRRSVRARLLCGYGCPCCGPPPPALVAQGLDSELPPPAFSDFTRSDDRSERRSLVLRAAAVDGCRKAPYVDTHIHLEMTLQKISWYESVPSLLEDCWNDLTDSEQQHWKALGHSFSEWNNIKPNGSKKGSNPIWFRPWKFLSTTEQRAAEALGWNASRWDGFEWVLPTTVKWWDLDKVTRTHLEVLGETHGSWESMFGLHKHQPAGFCFGGDMRTWEQLSMAEQDAASKLGFAMESWDMVKLADIHAYIREFCGSGFEGCITQGCDSDSIDDTVKLALEHEKVFAAFGCHPKSAVQYDQILEERILSSFEACGRKAIAWGECGLDFSNPYFKEDKDHVSMQIRVFERQLELALVKGLPIVLHIRDAAEEALRVLLQWVPRSWKAHIHAFHGPSDFVEAIMESFPNFYFGICGTVSMGTDGVRMAQIVPLDKMLLETDGPYIIPRGTFFNHAGQIPLIARWVAEERGCAIADVYTKCRANTKHIYGI